MNFKEAFKTDIPYDFLYQASRKEASRKKPVFFLHKYFARRITINFRLALLSLLSKESDDLFKLFYKRSQRREENGDVTILDPFMGGGTSIFEGLRFGCKMIGNDLQPLSLFVTKALTMPIDTMKIEKTLEQLERCIGYKIKSYYKTKCPKCGGIADSIYVFHVKKAITHSKCGRHRFFSNFVIAYKNGLFVVVCPKCGKIHKTTLDKGSFTCDCGWVLKSAKDGYVKKGVFDCPDCNEHRVLSDYSEYKSGYPFDTDIIAIEYYCPICDSHDYKMPERADLALFETAKEDFKIIGGRLPLPNQDIPLGYNTKQIINHGYRKFKDLFNERQLLCLGLLLESINNVEDAQTKFWLQLAFSGMLEMNNMFCRYQQNAYKICNIFFNHAYVPISMPVENCVWGTRLGTGTFVKTIQKIIRGKDFCDAMYDIATKKTSNGKYDSIQVFNGDSVSVNPVSDIVMLDSKHPVLCCSDSKDLSFIPDKSVDMVLTDPPYGANVMYSELIDFFHVWNYKSNIANELGFTTELSPKIDEIVVNQAMGKDFKYYENGIASVFRECYKKLKDNGYLVFSFHDRNIDSWLSVINSINQAGFTLIKCFPVHAETRTGAHTSNKNSIGIDIMLVSQKIIDCSVINSDLTLNERADSAISITQKKVLETLNRLQKVDAEITLPDVENIAIANFFVQFNNYNDLDSISKEKVTMRLMRFLNDINQICVNIKITKKRSGWWSEQYKQKWNTHK